MSERELGITDLILGTAVEVVGVEDDPGGGVRVYLVHRMRGIYCLAEGENAERARKAWAGPSRILIHRDNIGEVFKDERR